MFLFTNTGTHFVPVTQFIPRSLPTVAYHSAVLAMPYVLVQIPPVCCTRSAVGWRGKRPPLGQADTLLLLGFYVQEKWWWGGSGARERRRTDREVMGKMTLTPGTWRQVAEEEERWTATSERNSCGTESPWESRLEKWNSLYIVAVCAPLRSVISDFNCEGNWSFSPQKRLFGAVHVVWWLQPVFRERFYANVPKRWRWSLCHFRVRESNWWSVLSETRESWP